MSTLAVEAAAVLERTKAAQDQAEIIRFARQFANDLARASLPDIATIAMDISMAEPNDANIDIAYCEVLSLLSLDRFTGPLVLGKNGGLCFVVATKMLNKQSRWFCKTTGTQEQFTTAMRSQCLMATTKGQNNGTVSWSQC